MNTNPRISLARAIAFSICMVVAGVASPAAAQSEVDVDYRAMTAEALAADGEMFAIVLNLEVVEHVADRDLFLEACASMVKPGGLMFVATINRTMKAMALAIIGAEYVLRWLPRGTHDWKKFLTPEEIIAQLQRNGLNVIDQTGVTFNPLADEWRASPDMAVNYMVLAARPA